jgi:hypothetical protein
MIPPSPRRSRYSSGNCRISIRACDRGPKFKSTRPARKAILSTTIIVVEDHADKVLATFGTQHEAIDWAKKNGRAPLVARVRHLNDKKSRITGGQLKYKASANGK